MCKNVESLVTLNLIDENSWGKWRGGKDWGKMAWGISTLRAVGISFGILGSLGWVCSSICAQRRVQCSSLLYLIS